MKHSKCNEAVRLHRKLTEYEWISLRENGIPAIIAYERLLGWDGSRLTIPVFSYDRKVLFFEHAKWTEDRLEVLPKTGGRVALYGVDLLRRGPRQVILTEGIVESLVLAGQSFTALSSTGKGTVFKEEWVSLLRGVDEVFICFRRSEASLRRAEEIAFMIPQAIVVHMPEDVGEGEGIFDFFVRHGKPRRDFLRLLTLSANA